MEALPQNVSKDHLTITLGNTQPKSSENERENSLSIPIDIMIEIFSRLPWKSMARCRCVSKHWGSILRCPDFTELFFSMALARPQLLFASLQNKLVFYSAPQPQNPNENSSPLVASYHHMSFRFDMYNYEICNHVNGLILLKHLRKEKGENVLVICNPSTGQCLSLPKVDTSNEWVMSYFWYDPVEKQYKVLSVTRSDGFEEYQVLTLGEPSWRMIECCRPHIHYSRHVCINGVLYFTASVTEFLEDHMVVCFDVKSEKLRFIEEGTETFIRKGFQTLINYNGKLALVTSSFIYRTSDSIELWVLEDVDKQEWSKHTCVFPSLAQSLGKGAYLRFVGVTRTNEIVLASRCQITEPFFYVFYCNIKRKTIVRLQIQGIEASERTNIYTFVEHVENVKLLQVI
ncbi:F-box domain [Arabidopsis thaliana x Arabidopsis arenosa]|uniref:F-box domain n=1 Tax=Arabidopsis thaliana x Arabidopsis arenosa TaxID=1240361 RepID=A0A8T1XE95_9BRAS|nr:F-box domain [Arabidopsis thaliana x Arabidopsis arenosa]